MAFYNSHIYYNKILNIIVVTFRSIDEVILKVLKYDTQVNSFKKLDESLFEKIKYDKTFDLETNNAFI